MTSECERMKIYYRDESLENYNLWQKAEKGKKRWKGVAVVVSGVAVGLIGAELLGVLKFEI